jgi:hypothetical protein
MIVIVASQRDNYHRLDPHDQFVAARSPLLPCRQSPKPTKIQMDIPCVPTPDGAVSLSGKTHRLVYVEFNTMRPD